MSAAPPLLRIATRQSRLALWQAEHVAGKLREAHPALAVELVPMTTQGDRILDRSLAQVGGKGLFIKELEVAIADGSRRHRRALDEGRAERHAARHDARRDAAARGSARRVRCCAAQEFRALPQGARVGTSSLRRQCQLKYARPDLELITLRGNVETRLRKLEEEQYDAISSRRRGADPPRARRSHHAIFRPGAVRAGGGPRHHRHRMPRGRRAQH